MGDPRTAATGPLRPAHRARRLRGGVRGRHAGRRSHDVVAQGPVRAVRLDHRGPRGAEPNTGDGAGMMIQIPDEFLRAVGRLRAAAGRGLRDRPGVPADRPPRPRAAERVLDKYALVEGAAGARLAGRADRPTDLGATALAAMPRVRQVFLAAQRLRLAPATVLSGLDWSGSFLRAQAGRAGDPRARDRALLPVAVRPHDRLQGNADPGPAARAFYPDLSDERVSQRSRSCTPASPPTRSRPGRWPTRTGTSPTTARSTPIRGNRNWMAAREALLATAT